MAGIKEEEMREKENRSGYGFALCFLCKRELFRGSPYLKVCHQCSMVSLNPYTDIITLIERYSKRSVDAYIFNY